MKTNKKTLLAILFLAILLLPLAAMAQTNTFGKDINKSTLQSDALLAYNQIMDNTSKLVDLNQRGIGTARFEDEIYIATELFETAYASQQQGLRASFTDALARSKQTAQTIETAFGMKDELVVLKEEIDLEKTEIDTTTVTDLYNKAEQEFGDQRFEKTLEYINSAYEKISELQSAQAKSSAMLIASQQNLTSFVSQNWLLLAILFSIPIIIYGLFRKQMKRVILQRKHNMNETEVEVLKNEIRKTQAEYFVNGKLAEGTYHIRTKIYGDKIRDLNKENALIEEQMSGLGHAVARLEKPAEKKFAYKEKKGKKLK